jgi:hypothetical protein
VAHNAGNLCDIYLSRRDAPLPPETVLVCLAEPLPIRSTAGFAIRAKSADDAKMQLDMVRARRQNQLVAGRLLQVGATLACRLLLQPAQSAAYFPMSVVFRANTAGLVEDGLPACNANTNWTFGAGDVKMGISHLRRGDICRFIRRSVNLPFCSPLPPF